MVAFEGIEGTQLLLQQHTNNLGTWGHRRNARRLAVHGGLDYTHPHKHATTNPLRCVCYQLPSPSPSISSLQQYFSIVAFVVPFVVSPLSSHLSALLASSKFNLRGRTVAAAFLNVVFCWVEILTLDACPQEICDIIPPCDINSLCMSASTTPVQMLLLPYYHYVNVYCHAKTIFDITEAVDRVQKCSIGGGGLTPHT